MSHFTTIATRLVEKKYLIAALKEMGYSCKEGTFRIRDFDGVHKTVQLKVRIPNSMFEIGFWKENDRYVMTADWGMIQNIKQADFLKTLTQKYAYSAAKDQLAEQDFEVIEEKTEADKTIRITLRRMSG